MSAWADKYVMFRAVAQSQFGAFTVPATSSLSGVLVPRMSGDYAVQTLVYWRDESLRIARKYVAEHNVQTGKFFGLTPEQSGLNSEQSAGFMNWWANQKALQTFANDNIARCKAAGAQWIAEPLTIKIWDMIAPVALGMFAIQDTPSVSFIDVYAQTLIGYGKAAAEQLASLAKSAVVGLANAAGAGAAALLGAVLPPWLVPAALVAGGIWVVSKLRSRA